MLTATSTAAQRFYHTGSLLPGAWIWVWMLDGCSCGTEGALHRDLFSAYCYRKGCQMWHNNCVDSPGWWPVLWSSSSSLLWPTTWWSSTPATASTFTECGSANTTKSTCFSTARWSDSTFPLTFVAFCPQTQCADGVCVCLPQVQNGIAIYATWTTVASLVNLSIVLIKDAKMSPEDAVTLSFSLLTVLLLVW